MTPKQVASFVANAQCCSNCGEVFDSANHPHMNDDCDEGFALWGAADQEQIAARLYRMMTELKELIVSDIPDKIYVLEDDKGNRMNIPEDISKDKAFDKITQGFDVTIHTYVLQPPRIVKRKEQSGE